jgi:hypothetical protein
MMRLTFFSILLFALNSCQESKNQNARTVSITKGDHLINAFGRVGFDTSTFNRLNCGLSINSLGIVAYKATDSSLKFDSTKSLDIYLTTVYNLNSDSPGDDMKEMRFVVDTTTFIILKNGDFEDKNYNYKFTQMSDGGSIGISKKTKP